jgi:hypothetical protein
MTTSPPAWARRPPRPAFALRAVSASSVTDSWEPKGGSLTVKDGVEYHCVLASAPGREISDYKGNVYQTVDKTQHVNGGCRSLNSEGTEWECYIGQAAVDQQIISQGFLGQVETAPGVG